MQRPNSNFPPEHQHPRTPIRYEDLTAGRLTPVADYGGDVIRTTAIAAVIAAALLSTAGCSDDDPEVTRAELLAEIEGRSLSEAEIEERESVARALCQMDDDVLRAMWADMDNEQLAFQDFVFTQECGDRNPLYADSTGRFAADS